MGNEFFYQYEQRHYVFKHFLKHVLFHTEPYTFCSLKFLITFIYCLEFVIVSRIGLTLYTQDARILWNFLYRGDEEMFPQGRTEGQKL